MYCIYFIILYMNSYCICICCKINASIFNFEGGFSDSKLDLAGSLSSEKWKMFSTFKIIGKLSMYFYFFSLNTNEKRFAR